MKILLHANTDWYLYNFRMNLILKLKELGHEVYLVSPPGPYGPKLTKLGYKWFPIPLKRRSLNPISELRIIYTIYKLYREIKPDIVHHFTIKCVVYGSISAILTKVECRVNAITGMGYVFTRNNLFVYFLRLILKSLLVLVLKGSNSCLILQNSDDAKTIKHMLSGFPINIKIIRGSGVNVEQFRPKRQTINRNGKFGILLATRLLADKGVNEYIEAAKSLVDEKDLCFYVAGTPDEGNPSSISADQIVEWNHIANVKYLGHVDNMPDLLNQMDIVVLPSYREGTPKILLEAAATSLPIIATDVPGCREVVINGENGLLIKPQDSAAISSAILRLYKNKSLCHQMGINGRELIKKHFSDSRVVNDTISVYNELLYQAN